MSIFSRHHFYCTQAIFRSVWLVCERNKDSLALPYPTQYRAYIVRDTLQCVRRHYPDRLPIALNLMRCNLEDWESTRYWCGELIKKVFEHQLSENV